MSEPSGTHSIVVPRITACARCRLDHDDMIVRPLAIPMDVPGLTPLTHYGTCPTNGNPLLLRFVPEEDL